MAVVFTVVTYIIHYIYNTAIFNKKLINIKYRIIIFIS